MCPRMIARGKAGSAGRPQSLFRNKTRRASGRCDLSTTNHPRQFRGKDGGHSLNSQFVIVLAAFACVRVRRGLISAGNNQGSSAIAKGAEVSSLGLSMPTSMNARCHRHDAPWVYAMLRREFYIASSKRGQCFKGRLTKPSETGRGKRRRELVSSSISLKASRKRTQTSRDRGTKFRAEGRKEVSLRFTTRRIGQSGTLTSPTTDPLIAGLSIPGMRHAMMRNIEAPCPNDPMKNNLRRPNRSTSGNEMHAERAYTVARTAPRMSASWRSSPR